MTLDIGYWLLLPLFVLTSGNFSPFRVGLMLPIYAAFIFYVFLHRKDLLDFLRREGVLSLLTLISVTVSIIAVLRSIELYHIHGTEFLGAINPVFYSTLALLRYIFTLGFLVVYAANIGQNFDRCCTAISVSYFLIFSLLCIQALCYKVGGLEIGYLFPDPRGLRFGGFVGEPQTASAWMFSLFYVLYFRWMHKSDRSMPYGVLLIATQLLSLWFTQSTAWMMAFAVFVASQCNFKYILLLLTCFPFAGILEKLQDKISADLFTISERSISVVAGFQLFSHDLISTVFGYGIGLSPYLIVRTPIFAAYPNFNLSSLGRQTVMNSYLEPLFELGVAGAVILFYFFIKVSGVRKPAQWLALLPLMTGIFGVSGGFMSGYFLLAAPLILHMSANGLQSSSDVCAGAH